MNNMFDKDLKKRIYQYLCTVCRGEACAKRGKIIAKEFDTDWRTVAEIIRQLRIDGVLIGSSKGFNKASNLLSKKRPGYYIPETEQEVNNYFESFKGELFDMLKTYNRQKRARQQYIINSRIEDLFDHKYKPTNQTELTLSTAR